MKIIGKHKRVLEWSQGISWDIIPERRYDGTCRIWGSPHSISQQWFWDTMMCNLWDYFSALKIELIRSSKRSSDFQQTTQHYTPEGMNLHNETWSESKCVQWWTGQAGCIHRILQNVTWCYKPETIIWTFISVKNYMLCWLPKQVT